MRNKKEIPSELFRKSSELIDDFKKVRIFSHYSQFLLFFVVKLPTDLEFYYQNPDKVTLTDGLFLFTASGAE